VPDHPHPHCHTVQVAVFLLTSHSAPWQCTQPIPFSQHTTRQKFISVLTSYVTSLSPGCPLLHNQNSHFLPVYAEPPLTFAGLSLLLWLVTRILAFYLCVLMSLLGDFFFFSLSAPSHPCLLCAELPLTLAGLSLPLQLVTQVLAFCLCMLMSLLWGVFFFPFQLQVTPCLLFPPVPSLDHPHTVLCYFSLLCHCQILPCAQPLLALMSAPSHVESGPLQPCPSPLLPPCW